MNKKTSYADTTTYYVDPFGTDDGSHGTAPGTDAWQTIQYAVTNVPNPDTDTIIINISGDTYTTDNDDIDIDRDFMDLTLQGGGIDTTIIQPHADPDSATQGNFDIGWSETVTLKNMTIRYGKVSSGNGGGIAMDGTSLTLDTVKITENTTTSSSSGGGVYAPQGDVTITNSIISDNQSTSSGVGGVYLTGDDIYINTTVFDNNDSSSGLAGINISNVTSFLMENSTLSNSDTTAYTSGLNLYGNGTIRNSTFYNNHGDNVGAINVSSSSALTIVNSTFIKGGGSFANLMVNNGGSVYIKNCLLADREQGSDFYKGSSGTVYNGGYNLVETSGSFTFSETGDITGNQENLNAVPFISTNGNTNNSTQTIAILSGSPAVDAGNDVDYNGVSIPTTDQRGASRYGTLDIGAYEAQETETADPYISSASLDEDNGYIDVTFNEAVYTTSGGSGVLEAADFDTVFVQGIGGATGATITSVTKTDFGELSGGETTVRVNFTVAGTANGVETVEIIPASSTSIYDAVGNPMASNQTTGALTLNGHFDYYVNSGSGDDANTGGVGDPWQTIQHAIDNMVSPTATNNIIHLAEGVYTTNNDDIDIPNSMQDLTIQGHAANDTIIQPHTDPNSATVGNFDIEYSENVTIKDVTIRYGRGSGSGNGIAFGSGSLTIQNVILDDNDSTSGVAGINMGSSTFVMENSTLSNSDSPGYTSGINVYGTATIKNSTFYDNTGDNVGSINVSSSTTLTLLNSTFYKGGGDFANLMVNNGGTIYIKNCLLADREKGVDFYKGSSGTVYDGGYNIVETSGSFTFNATGDITGDQAGLNIESTLAYNSSEHNTTTLALNTDSVAINAGDSASYNGVSIPLTDQRGATRNSTVDIGAYEFEGYLSAPTISTLYPADDATGVSESSNLILEFSENVDAESGYVSIYDSEDTLFEQFDVTSEITGSGTDTIIINPSSNFAGLTSYYVQIDDIAFDDSASNSFAGISDDTTWSFTTGDEIAPSILTISPESSGTNIAVDANIIITFTENVDAESGYVSIYDSEDTLFEQFDVTSEITGSGTDVITINPSSNLEEQTQYYVQISTTAFDDTSSNSYAGITDDSTWIFTTGDFTDPLMTSLSPVDNGSDIEVDANVIIGFTENVNVESGNISLYKSGGTLVEAIDVTSSQVVGDGTAIITIDPTSDLEEGESYYIKIDASAFDDVSGNSYAGVSDSAAWNFTVGDFSDPSILSLSPDDGANTTAINANLVVTFQEVVDAESGDLVIYKASDNSIFETIDVTSSKVSGSGTAVITINPENDFASETSYYVKIDASAFDDTSGNSFAGIADSTTWNFTTADVNNPYVLTYSPEDDSVDVAVDANLVLTFSENVEKGSGDIELYTTSDNTLVETIDVTSDKVVASEATVTIDPEATLGSEIDYYIKIDSTAIVDQSNNSYAGISDAVTWNFTTADVLAPTIVVVSPLDNATDVAIDTSLTIQFSEVVEKGSGNIHIYKSGDSTEMETVDVTSSAVSGEGTDEITIDIQSLTNGVDYYIFLDEGVFTDEAGNSFAGITTSQTAWNFTTIALEEVDLNEDNSDNDDASGTTENSSDTSDSSDEDAATTENCYYTVESGDTLWIIASNTIGDGSQYQIIIDLNSQQYPEIENSLSIGWKLVVPCGSTGTKKTTPKSTAIATDTASDSEEEVENQDDETEAGTDSGGADESDIEDPTRTIREANDTSLPIVHNEYNVSVRLEENGLPLVGVKVELHSTPRTTTTDENGVATFSNVEPGEHTIKVVYDDYTTEEAVYVAGEDKEFNIQMDVELKQRLIPVWVWIAGILLISTGLGLFIYKKGQVSLKNRG